MSKIKLLAVLFSTLVIASRAQAQVSNGDFATGDLTNWQALGGPKVVTSGTDGLTTPSSGNQVMISSTKEDLLLQNSVTAATIESTLGTTLPSTSGTDPFGTSGTFAPVNGQAIYQTFTVSQATKLTFDFAFTTEDYFPYDGAGFVLDGAYTVLASPATYNGTNPPFQELNYQSYSVNLSAGTHTLGFVSYNTGGHDNSSNLYVSDVQPSIAGDLADVPEPGSWSLLLGGLGALILLRRLKKSA